MASQRLCCTVEERSASPDVPNVRVHDITISRPLLESKSGHKIPTAFKTENVPPMAGTGTDVSGRVERVQKAPRSLKKVISHQSIDKVKAMGAIIRRKFSKDLGKGKTVSADDEANAPDSPNMADDLADTGTVVKTPKTSPRGDNKTLEAAVRDNLLIDSPIQEDVTTVDEDADQVFRRSPLKRGRLNDIQWLSSAAGYVRSAFRYMFL